MPITLLPTAPKRTDDPDTFIARTDAFLPALNTFVDEANALAANLNAIAIGGAYAMPYVYDSSTASGDPGSGKFRIINSGANLLFDLVDSSGITRTNEIDTFDDSSSTYKGVIKLVKVSDMTKFALYNVASLTTQTGYRDVTVNLISSTGAFANGDAVIVLFQRTGDKGANGTLVRRTVTMATASSYSADVSNTDMVTITALAGPLTIANPTGTPVDGQGLVYRIKDNGTVRALSYGTLFRQSNELPWPSTTTVSKEVYMGFVYNAAAAKWDLIALVNNF